MIKSVNGLVLSGTELELIARICVKAITAGEVRNPVERGALEYVISSAKQFRALDAIHNSKNNTNGAASCAQNQVGDTCTAEEAAKFLGKSDSYIRRLCREGKLSSTQGPNGAWRISMRSLTAYKTR